MEEKEELKEKEANERTPYSEEAFWGKIKKFGKKAGCKVVYAALLLFYCLKDKKVPPWAKTVIIGALAYWISPLDAIPDLMPVAGYTDDLGTLLAALGVVATHINDDIRQKARVKLNDWFGQGCQEQLGEIDEKLSG